MQVGGSGLVAVSSGAFVSFDTEGIVFSWVGGILRRGAGFFLFELLEAISGSRWMCDIAPVANENSKSVAF